MSESVAAWWARRQFSRGVEVPYPVGTYRAAWAPFPALIRQYHPEFNDGITLTQIPPAAEVLLLWQCEVGHLFAATPAEQRARPQRERRRSSWCPECRAEAVPVRVRPADPDRPKTPPPRRPRPPIRICERTPDIPVGEAFVSECAPPPKSAVEQQLRADLGERLDYTAGCTAIRVRQPFFDHLEVWPDILIPELRVAIEYDSTGRHGLEHVGPREAADRRKDRAVRAARWEVIRIRTGKLQKLGPHDLQVGSTGPRTLDLLMDQLRAIRGSLIVESYRR